MTKDDRESLRKSMCEIYESAQAISRIAMETVKESHQIDEKKLAKIRAAISRLFSIMIEEIEEFERLTS